jgi:hypothetical protein
VITRILTQFEDLPQEDLDYLLDKPTDKRNCVRLYPMISGYYLLISTSGVVPC